MQQLHVPCNQLALLRCNVVLIEATVSCCLLVCLLSAFCDAVNIALSNKLTVILVVLHMLPFGSCCSILLTCFNCNDGMMSER
jgi:hypothetical protein